MHPREQVIVGDISKVGLWVVTVHNVSVYLLVRNRRNYEVTLIFLGFFDVCHVSIFLPGCQAEKISSYQIFLLRAGTAIVTKRAFAAIVTCKVCVAFADFVVKSTRPVVSLVLHLERSVMTVLRCPITNGQCPALSPASIVTTLCGEATRSRTTFLVSQTSPVSAVSGKLAFNPGLGDNNQDKVCDAGVIHFMIASLKDKI